MVMTIFENLPTILTTLSTAVIALFTAVLALATKRQAAILKAIEAPVPILSEIKLVEYVDPLSQSAVADRVLPGPIPQFCRVLPAVVNLGRTPAQFTRWCIEWVVSPMLPDAPICHRLTNWNFFLPPTGATWLRIDPIGDIRLTDDERQRIEMGRATFWVFGLFSYTTFFKESYDVRFLARWDLKAGFCLEIRPNYTYTRKAGRQRRAAAGGRKGGGAEGIPGG